MDTRMNVMLSVTEVTEETQEQARRIVCAGLEERFGELDPSYNKDLDDIVSWYAGQGHLFLTGALEGQMVCTGALIREGHDVGRIVRMSVWKPYRRRGIARCMLQELERRARQKGYAKLVLETTADWLDAVQFYKANGYVEVQRDEEEVHLEKVLAYHAAR
ncbi:GNAT family N-acetyltransferase [Paenibacillus oleatilyticus]|uniref:GNAT family N-acetyltransferase n=1 Tax=Paenibacillus oleatilyticus TaxID=2594886 RepID=A0ABV4V006_9BACL